MSRRAVSLVEILIASAIFLAAVVPLWGLMSSSHQQVLRSADEIKASQLTIEILEQIENSQNINCLPDENNVKEFSLQSGDKIILGTGSLELKVGTFEEYLKPQLTIFSTSEVDSLNDEREIGRVVHLVMSYKSKEGRDLTYTLRGFVSANN